VVGAAAEVVQVRSALAVRVAPVVGQVVGAAAWEPPERVVVDRSG
jgi:hypothetical protein